MIKKVLQGFSLSLLLTLGIALYFLYTPVKVDAAWQYTEIARDLPNISAVEVDANNNFYALVEDDSGRGFLIKLHDHMREHVIDNLNKPDGMVADGGNFIISEEATNGRLIQFSPLTLETVSLAVLQSAEGVAVDVNGEFLVVEDRSPGRLVKVSKNGDVHVLLDDLNRAEGVCEDKRGLIYIAEKQTGKILLFTDGVKQVLLEGLHKPGAITCATNGDLWITEDSTNAGRLILYHNGVAKVIASHLHNPQGISFDANGQVLLAEQGLGRILVFSQKKVH